MGKDNPIDTLSILKYSLSIGERDVCGGYTPDTLVKASSQRYYQVPFIHALAKRGGSVSYSPDIVLIESGINLKSILESHLNLFWLLRLLLWEAYLRAVSLKARL